MKGSLFFLWDGSHSSILIFSAEVEVSHLGDDTFNVIQHQLFAMHLAGKLVEGFSQWAISFARVLLVPCLVEELQAIQGRGLDLAQPLVQSVCKVWVVLIERCPDQSIHQRLHWKIELVHHELRHSLRRKDLPALPA